MKKSQKPLIRQTTIFSRLNEGQIVNVKELAEEFGVSVRTIQKDMNERLSTTYNIVDLGHGNYAFAKGYRLRSSENEEENIAISLMKSLQQSAIPDMDEYISSALPTVKNYEEMFLFDLDFESIEDMDLFKVILRAIKWRAGVEFTYTKTDGSFKEVTVHPYRIANFKNYWYLIAYDLLDEKIKSYHIKSITKLHNLHENFISDESTENELKEICSQINSAWYSGGESRVTLRVSGDARFYLERHLPSHIEIIEQMTDYTQMRMSYSDKSEVLSLVKRWLPDIEIVDDDLLRKKLYETLQSYLGCKKE